MTRSPAAKAAQKDSEQHPFPDGQYTFLISRLRPSATPSNQGCCQPIPTFRPFVKAATGPWNNPLKQGHATPGFQGPDWHVYLFVTFLVDTWQVVWPKAAQKGAIQFQAKSMVLYNMPIPGSSPDRQQHRWAHWCSGPQSPSSGRSHGSPAHSAHHQVGGRRRSWCHPRPQTGSPGATQRSWQAVEPSSYQWVL